MHALVDILASDLRAVLQCLGEDLDEDESKIQLNFVINKIINYSNIPI